MKKFSKVVVLGVIAAMVSISATTTYATGQNIQLSTVTQFEKAIEQGGWKLQMILLLQIVKELTSQYIRL